MGKGRWEGEEKGRNKEEQERRKGRQEGKRGGREKERERKQRKRKEREWTERDGRGRAGEERKGGKVREEERWEEKREVPYIPVGSPLPSTVMFINHVDANLQSTCALGQITKSLTSCHQMTCSLSLLSCHYYVQHRILKSHSISISKIHVNHCVKIRYESMVVCGHMKIHWNMKNAVLLTSPLGMTTCPIPIHFLQACEMKAIKHVSNL